MAGTRLASRIAIGFGRGPLAVSGSVRTDRVPAEIAPQDLRHLDRAVGPLVRLEERGDDPGQREAGPVDGVDELRLRGRLRPPADRHPARLVVAEVRA